MASKKDIHVVPHRDRWAVKREGVERPQSVHDTQREAIDTGRPIARRDETELVIHRPDGRIRDSDSYGNDPNPPRDRKH